MAVGDIGGTGAVPYSGSEDVGCSEDVVTVGRLGSGWDPRTCAAAVQKRVGLICPQVGYKGETGSRRL